jgi:hypothetical protein
MDTAVVNMPLSLKYALKLTQGTATVGFTAATGSMWQNHDILEWRFQASFICSLRFLCVCVCLYGARQAGLHLMPHHPCAVCVFE